MTGDRMDQQRLSVVCAIRVSQPDRFRRLSCPRLGLGQFAGAGIERRFRNAINDDILAHVVVVTDIPDVEIRNVGLRSRSDGDVFPVTRLCAGHAENTERITTNVKAVDEWSIAGVVVSPVGAGSLARRDQAAALGDHVLLDSRDRYGWTIRSGLLCLLA